jgi:uncharacterized membrane protein YfcA
VSLLGAMAVGVLAGTASGLMGIGGGVLFVPALAILLGKSQLQAEATSLVAILPVAVVGAWRQYGYGNVRLADGLTIGLLSILGVLLGTVVANALPERVLEIAFALLMLSVAYGLARRGINGSRRARQGDARRDRRLAETD